jgi:hypothetical protein
MPRFFTAAVLGLILLAAAACKTETVYDVRDEPVPGPAQGLARDELGRKITEAVASAHWRIDAAEPGRLWATYDVGKHAATVAVAWSERTYSITLASANNLEQHGDQIHRTYNVWVRNLEREINDALYVGNAGAARAAAPLPARAPPVAAQPAPTPAPVAALVRPAPGVAQAPSKAPPYAKIVGFSAAGLGLVALAVGGVQGGRSHSLLSDATAAYNAHGGAYSQADLATVRSANSAASTANLLFVVGGVLAVAGTVVALAF